MINCAICDDDVAVTKLLNILISEYSAEFECTTFNDPLILSELVHGGKTFDLYVLDIVMPAISGIYLAREIRDFDKDCPIIFLSSSDEFHRDAYDVEALQYLDKPVDKAKLFHTLDRVLKYIGENKTTLLPIQTKEGIRAIDINHIIFVESFRHVLTFHLHDKSKIESLDSSLSLEALTQKLAHPKFCVPYRGFIVNMDQADYLEKYQFSMITGDIIPVPQKQYAKVRQQYSDYLLTRISKGDS